MRTNSIQSFELNDLDVAEAIKEWIEKKFGPGNPISVDVSTNPVTCGFGPGEHTEYRVKITAKRDL